MKAVVRSTYGGEVLRSNCFVPWEDPEAASVALRPLRAGGAPGRERSEGQIAG